MIEHFPQDKSTIFSIAPTEIKAFKPGIFPGHFTIPECLDEKKPVKVIIGASEHIMQPGGGPPVRVLVPSYQIAKAIVEDFLNGQFHSNVDAHPGICWMQGDISLSDFVSKMPEYKSLCEVQKQWFVYLINQTEADWKKYKHPRVVSDQARFAVLALKVPTPEWMAVQEVAQSQDGCPACGTMNLKSNAICSNCKAILDEVKFSKIKFA